MSEIPTIDLSGQHYSSVLPTNNPNVFSFVGPQLGEGFFSLLNPMDGVQLIYFKCDVKNDVIIKTDNIPERLIAINYIVKASKNAFAFTGDINNAETLSNRIILVDETSEESKGLRLERDTQFEWFNINFSVAKFEEYFKLFLDKYDQATQDRCKNICFSDHANGILIPYDLRQEIVIRQMLSYNSEENLKDIFLDIKIKELLLYYFENLIVEKINPQLSSRGLDYSERKLMTEVKYYIDKDKSGAVSPKLLEEIFSINERKLKELFKLLFGLSLTRYIRKHKMNQCFAILLISDEARNIKAMAYNMGYKSISAFSRAFYAEFKIRPSEVSGKFSFDFHEAVTFEID